jgi:hypothetical protein
MVTLLAWPTSPLVRHSAAACTISGRHSVACAPSLGQLRLYVEVGEHSTLTQLSREKPGLIA